MPFRLLESLSRTLLPRRNMAAPRYPNTMTGAQNGSANGTHTVTALSRWSILDKQLPAVEAIKAIHVYDFDNTLFKTPLPNQKLWNSWTIGQLSSPEIFINGGWWHDSRILAATGEGVELEEPRGWNGWWNETIVELVKLSTQQEDALNVLLTGRSERAFGDLIKRIVTSKGLEFDMIGLKPAVGPSNEQFTSTMNFKQVFIEALMETYRSAEEIRIYEDRPKHVIGFRNFLTDYNKRQEGYGGQKTRGPITAEVVEVAEISTALDPVVEVAEVQHLVNSHNQLIANGQGSRRDKDNGRLMIKKTVFFTSYMISSDDTKRLLGLMTIPRTEGLRFHANQIMICPRPCPASILDKVGGMGNKMRWKVSGTACFENSIWAAAVEPIPATAKYHTDNPRPFVVLALRKGARPVDAGKIQNWQPVPPEKAYEIETTVGEKVLLRIEPEDPSENEYESLFANKAAKRKHAIDDDGYSRSNSGNYGSGRGDRGYFSNNYGGRGGNDRGGRGGYRGSGTPNRGYRSGPRGGGGHFKGSGRGGRGGNHGYRSLDDLGGRAYQPYGGPNTGGVSYDDNASAQQPAGYQSQAPPQQAPTAPYNFQFQQNWQQQPASGPAAVPGRPAGGNGGAYGGGTSSGPDFQNLY